MDYDAVVDYDYSDYGRLDDAARAMLASEEDEGAPPWGEGPPRFLVPPPPAPPSAVACRSSAAADLHFCQLEPVGAEFTQTAFPSLPIIAVCSSVVLVAVLVASFLLWKHKRKVQNFLPCKTQPQGRCDGGAITYDDVLINHHPTRLPLNADTLTPIELLDVKYGNYVQQHADPLTRTNFTIPTAGATLQQQQLLLQQQQQQQLNNHQLQQQQQHSNNGHRHNNGGRRPRGKKPFHHPIYEEVSDKGGCDSDIDDDSRTVASEDEFAEDELSVAGLNPGSATSSLQGSMGGDLYPEEAVPPHQDSRTLKERTPQFRDLNKLTHSLERNKDGHPSNSFQAKQNYYLNKSMLGPDFTYPDGVPDASCVSPSSGDMQPQDEQYPQRGMGSSLNFIPALLQQQQQRGGPASRSASNSPPPYGGQGISALYNPQVVSPPGSQPRIPDALLRELTFKMPGGNGQVAAMSSRSLPVPPSCRGGGGVLFTVESPYPPIPPQQQQQSPFPSMSRARSGSATEFSPPRAGGYYRPPTPPPPENIYASIDDVGPYTIDGRHGRPHHHHQQQQRKGAELGRNTFGRPGRAAKGPSSSSSDPKYPGNNVSGRSDESQAYGDIRPIYDARTACS